jgi:hypothetical protein
MKNLPSSFFKQMLICSLCLISYLPSSQAQDTGFQLPEDQHQLTVPFKLINNFIILPTVLDNGITADFILDTGVRTPMLFNSKIKRRIKRRNTSRKVKFSGTGKGEKLTGNLLTELEMQIGKLKGHGLPLVFIKNNDSALQLTKDYKADGVIGYQIFSKFVVEIDFKNQLITLTKPSEFLPNHSFQAAQLHIQDTKPYIHSFITTEQDVKKPVKLLIDTGANHFLLLENFAKVTKHLPTSDERTILGRGLSGNIEGWTGIVPKVEIINYELSNISTSFPIHGHYAEVFNIDGRDGTIGTRLLSHFIVTFDFSRNTLYLKENPKEVNIFQPSDNRLAELKTYK